VFFILLTNKWHLLHFVYDTVTHAWHYQFSVFIFNKNNISRFYFFGYVYSARSLIFALLMSLYVHCVYTIIRATNYIILTTTFKKSTCVSFSSMGFYLAGFPNLYN
jgi:hypothetical protein